MSKDEIVLIHYRIPFELFKSLNDRDQKRFLMISTFLSEIIFINKYLVIFFNTFNDSKTEIESVGNRFSLLFMLRIQISKLAEFYSFLKDNKIEEQHRPLRGEETDGYNI